MSSDTGLSTAMATSPTSPHPTPQGHREWFSQPSSPVGWAGEAGRRNSAGTVSQLSPWATQSEPGSGDGCPNPIPKNSCPRASDIPPLSTLWLLSRPSSPRGRLPCSLSLLSLFPGLRQTWGGRGKHRFWGRQIWAPVWASSCTSWSPGGRCQIFSALVSSLTHKLREERIK